jgi:hypothetical protein
MIYVIYDYEGDIVCACDEEEQAQEIIKEQDEGILFSVLVPLYSKDAP